MISGIIDIIANAVYAVISWFDEIVSRTSADTYIIAIIGAVLVTRLIIMPIMGGKGASDKAKRSKDNE